ncbi:L-2-hydroxyglutarate oxidase LhgO [Haloactinopolyspora alba]|uniref:L-2-hydroxyglutarate oxidase LhgO n=1 Tax=Haloactinopolyspora alba TaxID=648780 RepID=A0A2P8EBY4_9ACTN|nr:L-2-hydroxyglutarate oxidase [Haloactinopolyspora alba]PSL06964.1 L-2-hydroxyglutarate oxidase LhgO [Haloactinopolyspora alba]
MTHPPRYAVVGGGIIGSAVARALARSDERATVTVLEKEDAPGTHQTGRNSGVVHAGLYYPPGSAKARFSRRGVSMLRDYCEQHGLTYDECGKLLVALDERERRRMSDIHARALANGVPGVRWVDGGELGDIEPYVRGVAGLHSPTTAIVDFTEVASALLADAVAAGGTVRTGFDVTGFDQSNPQVLVHGAHGETLAFDRVVIAAGLHSDRLARLAGDDEFPRIVPFRGEFGLLRPQRRHLVQGLVYPVPDPRFPFLGVHLTRRVDGEVMVGPNAVLAFAREGYRRRDVDLSELRRLMRWPGFRRFAWRNRRTAVREMYGSLNRRAFAAAAARYVPGLTAADVMPGPSGIRAQAMDADGTLVDDFRVTTRGRVVCVRNAPSPAATACLAIADDLVAGMLDRG